MKTSGVRFINLRPIKPKVKKETFPTNRFIIACFSRSFDSFHLKKQMINLVGSMFYTNYLDTTYSNLLKFLKNEEIHYIIKISNNGLVDYFNVLRHGANLVEIQISFLTFIGIRTYFDLRASGLNSDNVND